MGRRSIDSLEVVANDVGSLGLREGSLGGLASSVRLRDAGFRV